MNHFDTLSPVYLPDPVERHHPINRGLVSWWLTLPGLDGGRTFYDIAGMNHGTLTNMTTSASGWRGSSRPGAWGALQFDGSDDRVTVPTPTIGTTQTILLWTNKTGTTDAIILGEAAANGYAPYIDATRVYFRAGGAGGEASVVHGGASGSWIHWAIVRADTAIEFFKNGVSLGTGTVNSTSLSLTTIGSRGGGSVFYTGPLDDIRIYNRAMSAAEVRSLYDLSRNAYPGVLRRLSVPMPGGSASRLLMLRRRAA